MRSLRSLVLVMGVACALIGVFHFVLGVSSVPGEAHAGATVDSRERFYGAVFFGYGVAWLWAGRQSSVPLRTVRYLAGILLLGGLGRILSLAIHGSPQWFQTGLTVIEVGLPPIFIWLSAIEAKARRQIIA